MFTEKEIREAKCYGHEKHGIWIHAPTHIVHSDGTMSIANMDIQSYMGLIPPDDAVRILRERGVIVAEPTAPAQPDKWAHLPTDGEWTKWNSGKVWHFRSDNRGGCIYQKNGMLDKSHHFSVKHTNRDMETFITRAEAIAIFDANATPDHIPDAGEMVGAKLAVAEARIAVLEQQLADATQMALNADECANQYRAAHAKTGDELYDARRDIIALRERAAAMAKGIGERDSLLGKLRQQLDDTTASEAVMADELATAEAAVADSMEQVDAKDKTIAKIDKEASILRNHIESTQAANQQQGILSDRAFVRTASMCMAAEYEWRPMGDNAPIIVTAAEILLAEIKKRESETR